MLFDRSNSNDLVCKRMNSQSVYDAEWIFIAISCIFIININIKKIYFANCLL